MPSRIHSPTPTMMMLIRNGMRQPQTRNWSPESQLKTSTAKLAKKNPAGAPNCGQEAMKPRLRSVRAHSIANNTEPPHSPPTPIPWIKRMIVNSTADADALVGRHEAHGYGGEAGHQQCRDQGCLAADPVAPVAEYRRPDRPAEKPDEKDGERLEHPDHRIGFGEEEFAEDQCGDLTVE